MRALVFLLSFMYGPDCLLAVCPSESVTLYAQQGPQFISSPNYPGEYGVYGLRLFCSWILRAAPEFDDVVIQIQVLNSSLEPSTGCLRDAVLVVDGTRSFHSPLTSWCGDRFPSKPIVSTGRSAYIQFSTDFEKNDYTGFSLAFWVAKKPLQIVNIHPWEDVNYALLGISIVIFSLLIGFIVVLGMVRSWQHYRNHDTDWFKFKKCT